MTELGYVFQAPNLFPWLSVVENVRFAAHNATAAGAVPTMWARVTKETDLLARNDISSIRRLMLGSVPMTMGLWEKIKHALPNVTISIGYGTTEAGPAVYMFVCSGENIYPGEVEKLLERHPQVQQAVVVPLPDEERSQVPVAFIVTRADARPSAEEIRKFTIANGPAYQHPRRIEFVDELPWAGTNKIDRKSLIARARSLEAAQGWSA
jgi:acyl-CoA synthetase (AMP-forming)/AMP-acid ligase II